MHVSDPGLNDPAEQRFARRLQMLEELSEIGMAIARSLRPGAEMTQTSDTAVRRDPAAAFAQVARAIRLTLALEARTEAELQDWRCGIVRRQEDQKAHAQAREAARTEQVRDLVMAVAAREARDIEDHLNLDEALNERLDYDQAYAELARRPLRETVARLCADLGLAPDWKRWGDDGWIDDGPPVRPRGSPFHQRSRTPLLDDDLQPLAAQAPPEADSLPADPAPDDAPHPPHLE